LLKDPNLAHHGRVDFVGLALLACGLGSMQYVLTEGEQNYWFADPVISAMTAIMVVSLALFCYWELYRTDVPVVDLRVLRNRSVAAGSALGLALGAAIFGSTYTLPQFTQGSLGFTPTLSGMLFILRAVPIMIATPFVVRLGPKIDPRVFLGSGFLLIAVGSWLQALVTTTETDFWSFALALILTGIGASLLFVPLSIAVLGATTPSEGPKAGAFVNLATQLGGSISVAGLAVLLDWRESFHSEVLGANATTARGVVAQFLQHGSQLQLAELVDGQAQVLSYADAAVAIAVISLACVPLVLFMRRGAQTKTAVEFGG